MEGEPTMDPLELWAGRGCQDRPRVWFAKDRKIWVRLPFAEDNKTWLRGENRHRPTWNRAEKRWETPRTWKGDLLRRCIERYGSAVYIALSPNEMEVCAPACWHAISDVTDCTCSCGGERHGSLADTQDFYEVGEALAVRSMDNAELTARVLTAATGD